MVIESIDAGDFICAIDKQRNQVWPIEIDSLWTQPKGNNILFMVKAHKGDDFLYRRSFRNEQDAMAYMNTVSSLMHELGQKKVERQLRR
ncbi:hypothetical protein ACFSJQ_01500 [Vibrio olivae]